MIVNCSGIDWSPDGRHIVYAGGLPESGWKGGIYVADRDGSNSKLLASDGCQPTWSPDGSRIAFIGYQGGHGRVEVVEPGSPNSRRTAYTLGEASCECMTTSLSWFPDSRRLLVSYGLKKQVSDGVEILALNLDEGSASTLFDTAGQAEANFVQAIALSDGRHIVYRILYKKAGCLADPCYSQKLVLWNLDNAAQKEVSLDQDAYVLRDFDWWQPSP
jgi:Tol biopolymer transport system component